MVEDTSHLTVNDIESSEDEQDDETEEDQDDAVESSESEGDDQESNEEDAQESNEELDSSDQESEIESLTARLTKLADNDVDVVAGIFAELAKKNPVFLQAINNKVQRKPSTTEYAKIERMFTQLNAQDNVISHMLNSQNVYAVDPYLQKD
ncbi:6878_t:CDS:10 [Dentiscutata erythropus]|uniref:6878_t:CDS:1 n=1 Tax=Dentiscutata erythropus TaxID=1348616 RepID=A0A9N8YW47_9GLOM|nr:6878_t:CDS:10 [Dentiscutata erythropus]